MADCRTGKEVQEEEEKSHFYSTSPYNNPLKGPINP
jgi:hypothetical protein